MMGGAIGQISAESLAAVRDALGPVKSTDPLQKDATTQGITTGLGLVGYNLEAPAKLLQPQISILRNRLPRKGGGYADAVHWKKITAVNANKIKATGFAEGARNSAVSFSEVDGLATYKAFGLDGFVTFEAVEQGRNFEDIRARGVAGTLQAVMIEEEKILLGGNVSALGAPASLTVSDNGTGGPFTAATAYRFAVSAVTLAGFINGSKGNGGADALDESTGRQTDWTTGAGVTNVKLSWPAVRGAVAYNVYCKATASASPFYAFTTGLTNIAVTTAVLAAVPSSGNVPNTADKTNDTGAFDGLIAQQCASAGNGYFKDLQGATMTADNAGGIVEWDDLLQSIYNATLSGPDFVLVSAQDARNALKKIATGGSNTSLILNANIEQGGTITGGLRIGAYLNKFTQELIPVLTHAQLPAGLQLFIPENLPYPQANIPNVIEVDVRQEYTQYDWALANRKYEFGVYGTEVLKHYFPAGGGAIAGVGNG
jgi:hypothetical protein